MAQQLQLSWVWLLKHWFSTSITTQENQIGFSNAIFPKYKYTKYITPTPLNKLLH